MPTHKTSRFTFYAREGGILGLFCLLTLVMLFPLSINLSNMVPDLTDPLLNVWRMQWNAHTFLSGPAAIASLFDANIFYPFPLTLAYSEHFLMESALALPFLLIADSHLIGLNVSVLIYFTLSGYAMYLLLSTWTGNRWAGWVAGVLFAFSPHHFGQLLHLELLATPWLPLALLALHWTLTRPDWRYAALLILFFNMQVLSNLHFALNLALAGTLLALVYALTGRIRWRRGLWAAGGLTIICTFLLNWPLWQMYLRFSDVMGAVRTPGAVRVYSAAITDYLTAIPYNWLYGWTFGYWQSADHQFQPLMPFGLAGLFLALIGLILNLRPSRPMTKDEPRTANSPSHIPHPISPTPYPPSFPKQYVLPVTLFFCLLIPIFLLLSFGLNEIALGPNMASLLKYSPYFWLYEHVIVFKGIRVPARNSIMVVIGLIGLAGWGIAWLTNLTARRTPRLVPALSLGLVALILLESWSAPLVGLEIPAGHQIPPVYDWLRTQTAEDTVILELPADQNHSEFMYEYYSSHHWRRLANGATGFTPPIYREMRQWFKTFPDTRSVDVIQQLGIDLIILHSAAYKPDDWQRLLTDLLLFLPAFTQVNQVGEALVLHVNRPGCQPQPDQVRATLIPEANLDGLSSAVQVTYHNAGLAAFVAEVRQASRLTFADGAGKNFTEPLVIPAGEAQSVVAPLSNEHQTDLLTGAWLASLNRTVTVTEPDLEVSEVASSSVGEEGQGAWRPLGLKFTGGPQLVAYRLNPETPTACSKLALALKWASGQAEDTATVQLLDPFGRVVIEQTAQPWADNNGEIVEIRTLPLAGPLPAGRYGLRVYVHSADGQERLPITREGVTIPTSQIPPLPVVVHPAPAHLPEEGGSAQPLLNERIRLLGNQMNQTESVTAGDWLRFSLVWQAEQPIEADLTVFTQLLGPDGQVWGQQDNQPKGGWYGTSHWLPGLPVTDDYAFQIDPAAPAGEYHLIAGMYDAATGKRVIITEGPGEGNNFVEVATITVATP